MNIQEIFAQHEPKRENLLKVLHQIQEEDPNNHVSEEAVGLVARWLQLPVSSVFGVLKYYAMFSTSPRGKHLIRVCNSVVCHMYGAEKLNAAIGDFILRNDQVTADELMYTIEYTECLGHCAEAPAVMVGAETYGAVTGEMVVKILEKHQKSGDHDTK